MHTIVYSLSASRGMGSLRYSNSLEPLRELETVRIKLVKDFIDEPMLAAKFPHALYCMHDCKSPGKLVRPVRELSEGFGSKHSYYAQELY